MSKSRCYHLWNSCTSDGSQTHSLFEGLHQMGFVSFSPLCGKAHCAPPGFPGIPRGFCVHVHFWDPAQPLLAAAWGSCPSGARGWRLNITRPPPFRLGCSLRLCGLPLVAVRGFLILLWSTARGHMGLVAPRYVEFSQTQDQSHVPCIGRQILNHWPSRGVWHILVLKPHLAPHAWPAACLPPTLLPKPLFSSLYLLSPSSRSSTPPPPKAILLLSWGIQPSLCYLFLNLCLPPTLPSSVDIFLNSLLPSQKQALMHPSWVSFHLLHGVAVFLLWMARWTEEEEGRMCSDYGPGAFLSPSAFVYASSLLPPSGSFLNFNSDVKLQK